MNHERFARFRERAASIPVEVIDAGYRRLSELFGEIRRAARSIPVGQTGLVVVSLRTGSLLVIFSLEAFRRIVFGRESDDAEADAKGSKQSYTHRSAEVNKQCKGPGYMPALGEHECIQKKFPGSNREDNQCMPLSNRRQSISFLENQLHRAGA